MIKVNKYKIDPKSWFDLWHFHPNEENDNDISKRLSTLFTHYEELNDRISKCWKHYQIWIILDLDNQIYDSIFIHTENPQSQYPYKFEKGNLRMINKNQVISNIQKHGFRWLKTKGFRNISIWKDANGDSIV